MEKGTQSDKIRGMGYNLHGELKVSLLDAKHQ